MTEKVTADTHSDIFQNTDFTKTNNSLKFKNCWGNNQLRSYVDPMTSRKFNPQV